MIPVLTPEEMGEVDRRAPEPVAVLIGRAGGAVARAAVELLGGTYGRRVVVLAGRGNNGNDGREAARRLARRGVGVSVVDVADAPAVLPAADLVIDAAFGTGFRGSYEPPALGRPAPVLAVDIPSGVEGLTGAVPGSAWAATRTVTFAALKPGLLFEPGHSLAGPVTVADIGLDVSAAGARTGLVEAGDVATWLPTRAASAHKWQGAVWVVAGSPGMTGAAALAAGGAQRAGAGYVRLSTPGAATSPGMPIEVVQTPLDATGWAAAVSAGSDRFGALVVGNGLGLDEATQDEVRRLACTTSLPCVVDGDGLTALAADPDLRLAPHVILTPHDGEFARLAGEPPGADRLAAARDLAARVGAVVLLKGGPTVVAHPDGRALVVAAGDARLATAGTGDVLAGIIGALAGGGADPWHAAAAGAFLHGAAGALGWRHGLVAGDLLDHLPEVFDRLQPG